MLTASKVHIPGGSKWMAAWVWEQVRGANKATAAACLQRCLNLERRAHRFLTLFPRTMCQIFLLFFEKPVGGHRWKVGGCKGKEDGVGAERTACAPLQARPCGPRWRRTPRSSPPPPTSLSSQPPAAASAERGDGDHLPQLVHAQLTPRPPLTVLPRGDPCTQPTFPEQPV